MPTASIAGQGKIEKGSDANAASDTCRSAPERAPIEIWCNGRLNSQSPHVEHTTRLFGRQVARFPRDHWRLTQGDAVLAEHTPKAGA